MVENKGLRRCNSERNMDWHKANHETK